MLGITIITIFVPLTPSQTVAFVIKLVPGVEGKMAEE